MYFGVWVIKVGNVNVKNVKETLLLSREYSYSVEYEDNNEANAFSSFVDNFRENGASNTNTEKKNPKCVGYCELHEHKK